MVCFFSGGDTAGGDWCVLIWGRYKMESRGRYLYDAGILYAGDAEQRQRVLCAGRIYAGILLGLYKKTGDAEPVCGGLYTLLCGGQMMHFLMQIHPNPDLEYDFITELILNGRTTWVLLGLCLVLCLFLYGRRNRPYQAVRMQWVGRAVFVRGGIGVGGSCGAYRAAE